MTDKRKVLVLGALSAMAQATSRRLAADGADLVLAGRDATTRGTEAGGAGGCEIGAATTCG